MTLSEVLRKYDRDFSVVEIRKVLSIDSNGVDDLLGMAKYHNKMLISLDGGKYHLNDQVVKDELFRDDWLIVWRN